MKVERERSCRRRIPGGVIALISVVLTLAVVAGAACLVLGRSGISLLEGYVLAKYAFVETDADLDAAVDEALTGFVDGLGDRWSYYMTAEDYEYVMDTRANNYVGVGVTVNYEREEGLLVVDVTAGGPAEEAGIVAGDVIVAADGTSIAGEARHTATDLIKGEEGTQVTLTLLHADGTQSDVVCTRRRLQNSSASGQMLEDGVGYVYLANFYSGSSGSFRDTVDGLLEQGAEKLVIDLRSNPGGYVSELELILDYLLPEGPVFTDRPRWGKESVYYSDASCVEVPMVVLVNRDSYSAAELMAAQLRESAGIPIVGEVTSGKGYSQQAFPLPNGGGIGLSTAAYCTGSGHSLIGEGILPDVELSLDDSGEDVQLQAAIELLNELN